MHGDRWRRHSPCDKPMQTKLERERGLTVEYTLKEFYTDKWHYTIIDAPGEK